MTDLHAVTVGFVIAGLLAIASFFIVAFWPDRSGLPDPESLLDPEYRNLDVEKVLGLKQTK